MYKLLIVDDHALVREALTTTLVNHFLGTEVKQAESLGNCLALLENDYDPDLIIYDLNLTDHRGPTGIAKIHNICMDVPVLVISAEQDKQTILTCLSAGAAGFALKANSKEDFILAVEQVLDGQIYFPDMNQVQIEDNQSVSKEVLSSLSNKQLQVLALIAEGHANKEICSRLHIAETTVKTHVSEILKKLGVKNRTKAALAVDKDLIKQILDS